jgi:tRNA pseudouridine55 synthase
MIHKVENGYILNIFKPEGWTSFNVVKKIKIITRAKKVGHAGSLDPFATGVLLVVLNGATKMVNDLMDLTKEYEAILLLGKTTDTLDITGKITQEKSVPLLTEKKIKETFKEFIGITNQKIPVYAAAKHKGIPLYKLTRQGKEVPEKHKQIVINKIELLNFDEHSIHFKTSCGKGTYIRTLGSDIAKKLGTFGFLKELKRTKIGTYSINDSLSIKQFEYTWQKVKKEDESFS